MFKGLSKGLRKVGLNADADAFDSLLGNKTVRRRINKRVTKTRKESFLNGLNAGKKQGSRRGFKRGRKRGFSEGYQKARLDSVINARSFRRRY